MIRKSYIQILFIIAVMIVNISLSYSYANENLDTLNKISKSNTITLGFRESAFPFSYYDEKLQVVGYSYELMLKIVDAVKVQLNRPNLKIEKIPVTLQNRIPNLINGNIDLECGATVNTAERRKKVDFSDSIFMTSIRLMTKVDSGINSFNDLPGKNIVTTKATTSETLLNKLNNLHTPKISLLLGNDHSESFSLLENGRADAFVMDDIMLVSERSKAKNPELWVIKGLPQSNSVYGCIMRKKDTQLNKIVNNTLAKLMKSGEAEILYKKWFESSIPPKGVNLNFPLSEEMKALFKSPNNKSSE